MRSYVEILNELMETVDADCIPDKDSKQIKSLAGQLMELLWPYSE